MKKLFRRLFLISMVILSTGSFVSCSSDDDGSGHKTQPATIKTGSIKTLYVVSKTALDIANLTIEYVAPSGAKTTDIVSWDKCTAIDKSNLSLQLVSSLTGLDTNENRVYCKDFSCNNLPDTCVAKVKWVLKEGVTLADKYTINYGMYYILTCGQDERVEGSTSSLSFKSDKVEEFFNRRSKDYEMINSL